MSFFQSSWFQSDVGDDAIVDETGATDAPEAPEEEPLADEETPAQPVEDDVELVVNPLNTTPFDVERSCTDWWCLLVAIAIGAGAVYSGLYIRDNTNVAVLKHGYSYQRLVCHSKAENPLEIRPESERTYAFWCLNATRTGLLLEEPICLDSCPMSDYTYHLCEGGQVHRQDYPTVKLGFFCMPLDSNLAKKVETAFAQRRGDMLRLFGVVIKEWFLLAMAGVIACTIGYLYMIALFFDAESVVHGTLMLITFLPLGTGVYLLLTALEPFSGGAMDVYSYMYENAEDAQQRKLGVGAFLALLGLALWCLTSRAEHRRSIHRAAACMEAAGDCMTEEWSILLAPLVSIALEVVIMVFGFYFICCVAADIQERELKVQLFDKTYGTTFAENVDTLQFGTKDTAEIIVIVLFCYWLNEVVVAVSQSVVAIVTEVWYFARDDTREGTLCKAYGVILLYHLGTTCLGAFLKAFGRIPAYVIGILRHHGVVKPDSWLDHIYFIVLGHGAVFAYVHLGFHSQNYCVGALKADETLKDEITDVDKLRGALWVFNLAGVGLCAAGAAYMMDVLIRFVPTFSDPTSPFYIVEERGVFLTNGIVGAILGRNIMVGFTIVFDTIIYCYAIELVRRKKEIERDEMSFQEQNRMLLWMMPQEEKDEESDEEENHFLPPRMKDAYFQMRGSD